VRRWAAALLTAMIAGGAEAQQRVDFPSADQHITGGAPTTLSGILRKPVEGAGPFPAIVGLHGCAGLLNEKGEERAIQRQWGQRLVQQGYVVLMVDSFAPRGIGNACGTGDSRVSPTTVRPFDALGALRYLQARSDVKPERVGLIGWSHGGGAAVHTMRAEFAEGQAPYYRVGVALYPGSCSYNALGVFRPTAPLLVLIGEADNWTPPRPCQDVMSRAARDGHPVEFVLYPDAVHAFDAENQPVIALQGVMPPGRAAPLIGTNVPARDDARKRALALYEAHLKAP
jgi:dienelactone hydrolase